MCRHYVPSKGISEWQNRLAQPEKHWRRQYSAYEMAVSWVGAEATERGLPESVGQVLDRNDATRGATLLLAFPEHKVALPGGVRASQTDVWALLRSPVGLISMAVEGKADEPFGDTLADWQEDDSIGKQIRLSFLSEALRPPTPFPPSTRYQLLHRTTSAIIEARRFGASSAVMMVQSFRPQCDSFEDYVAFGRHFGADLASGALVQVRGHSNPSLYLGWAVSPLCCDAEVSAAGTV